MRGIVIQTVLVDTVKESREAVIITLLDRVKFVIMAMGALESERQDRRAEGVNPVGDVFCPPFFFDAAAFVGLAMEPIESGGQPLLTSGIGQEIAGELLDQEPIIGKVPVERLNDPIPVRPGGTELIALVAVTVGIASSIQ